MTKERQAAAAGAGAVGVISGAALAALHASGFRVVKDDEKDTTLGKLLRATEKIMKSEGEASSIAKILKELLEDEEFVKSLKEHGGGKLVLDVDGAPVSIDKNTTSKMEQMSRIEARTYGLVILSAARELTLTKKPKSTGQKSGGGERVLNAKGPTQRRRMSSRRRRCVLRSRPRRQRSRSSRQRRKSSLRRR